MTLNISIDPKCSQDLAAATAFIATLAGPTAPVFIPAPVKVTVLEEPKPTVELTDCELKAKFNQLPQLFTIPMVVTMLQCSRVTAAKIVQEYADAGKIRMSQKGAGRAPNWYTWNHTVSETAGASTPASCTSPDCQGTVLAQQPQPLPETSDQDPCSNPSLLAAEDQEAATESAPEDGSQQL